MNSWQEFWESVSVAQAIIWILGILAVLAFFVKGWPKIRAFVAVIDSLTGLPKFMSDTTRTLEAQDKKIADIHHETHKNNGSSIKDAVIRTEEALERVELGVKGLYDRTEALAAVDAELRKDLEDTRPKAPKRRTPKPKENP